MGLSLKLAVLSATVVSTAIMFKLISSPFITTFAISDIPFIWATLISWLKPPYLYVVLNCIIITIVASSRLQSQSKLDNDHHSLSSFRASTELVKTTLPVELPPIHQPEVQFPQPVDISVEAGYNSESNPNSNPSSKFVEVLEPEFSTPEVNDICLDEEMKIAKEAYEEIKKNKVNKSVISMSAWTPSEINQVGLTFPKEKPPASARFSHRKPAKAAPEGGRTLGVAKPKRQDTLETTWKAITEGRSVTLTRHLCKSDTWETHGHRHENLNSDVFSSETHPERITKSDTFNGTTTTNNSRKPVKPPPVPSKLNRSGGSGRLKKEPSLGQEELNRRVEAFIKKFNEDMRLQRQESLNRFMEMINRGA